MEEGGQDPGTGDYNDDYELSLLVSFGAKNTGLEMGTSTTTSTPVYSSGASFGPMAGVSTAPVPFLMTSSAYSVQSMARESSSSGGTAFDVGQQGASVSKRAGSLLGLAIAFVVAVLF